MSVVCHIRVIDTFGTEPAYNHEDYATLHGYRTNWGYWNLNSRQYMTMFPHTPDNSFMGFVSEELNNTEKRSIMQNKVNNMAVVYGKEASMWKIVDSVYHSIGHKTHTPDNSFMGFVSEELNNTEKRSIMQNKVNNMAVVYGKEASMWKGKEGFLQILHRYMEVHGTVYYETQRPPEVPAYVKNHGLLPQHELQMLLRKAKLFIGFGFPYEGPAPLEAIANGCIYLQPKFHPPHSSLNHEFFRGKPTSREVSSQHPYAEQYIGRPHVMTVDYNNSQEFDTAIREIMNTKDFCTPEAPFPPANSSSSKLGSSSPASPGPQFVLLPNSSALTWAPNTSAPTAWPPLSSLRLLASQEGKSCVEACQRANLVCEPALFRFVNNKEALRGLEVQCEVVEAEVNHVFPAFSVLRRECGLQKDPLLYSCAGHSPKYRRLCPCRDYRRGQVALCRDCL
ncbi:unnamed protein product [Coregonus sp. 'balchen']|nr:unnamed protein product [Coregonus sp. 'balchen']